jgi:hypothetical protein
MLGWNAPEKDSPSLARLGTTVMSLLEERSPAALYKDAAHRYVEGHQACAWCGERHCVFETQHGARLEYSCNRCDFYVCYDLETGQYHATPGCLALIARQS